MEWDEEIEMYIAFEDNIEGTGNVYVECMEGHTLPKALQDRYFGQEITLMFNLA